MKRILLYVSLISLLAAPASAEVEYVTCPSEPPAARRLQLAERWRVDVDDPDAPVWGYTYESQVLAHADRIFMLDAQLCNIHVFDNDGTYLGRILGEGDGPGEVRSPGSMFLCRDGRIAVQFGYPSKLEIVDLDGDPVQRWQLRANAFATKLQDTPLGWFGVYTESKQSEEPGVFVSELHVALHDADGQRTHEFHSAPRRTVHGSGSTDEEDDYLPWRTAVVVGDGELVYAAERNEYRLEWRNLNGDLVRVATRPYPAHRRTSDELDELKYRSYSIVNGDLEFSDRKLSDTEPVIGSIDELADGRLRVRTSLYQKELPADMVCRYEVHEATGELRERVEIYDPTGSFDVDYDIIALLNDDRAVVLRNVRPASRAVNDVRLHPKVREKLRPVPDDRENIAFVPIVYDLVPY